MIVAKETVIVLKKESRNPTETIGAWRSWRGVERDKRHRFADRFNRIGRANKVRALSGGHVSRSVDRLESWRPRNGDNMKTAVASKVAKRGRFVSAQHDHSIDLAGREPVERLRQRLISLIRGDAQAGEQHSAAGRGRAIQIAKAYRFSL